MKKISNWLLDYNGIIKENDELYHNVTRNLGLSESVFWILYTLREEEAGITQSDIVKANHLPPQTINSALKKLEAEGYLELRSVNDKRKKQVYLTEKGEELATRTADRVIEIENKTLESLTREEQVEFIRLFRKYTDQLKKNLMMLDGEKKNE